MTDKQIRPGSLDHIRRLTAERLRKAREHTRTRLAALDRGQRVLPFGRPAGDR